MKNKCKKYILENADRKTIRRLSEELNIGEAKIKKFLKREREKKERAAKANLAVKKLSGKALVIVLALIAAAGLIAYANSLGNEFVWDDFGLISENLYLRSWDNLQKLFTEDIISGAGIKSAFYRPIQMFTYLIDYSLWKLNPAGYHFSSALAHIAVALAIFWLLNVIFNNWMLSFIAAVLYVVHPIHTEAVTYISGRADSLAAVFVLLTMVFYVRQYDSRSVAGYSLMLVSYVLALFSKENAVIAPVLILAFNASFRKRPLGPEFVSLIAVTVAYFVFRKSILPASLPEHISIVQLWQRIPIFFAALANYARLLILPFDLHMEYEHRIFVWNDPVVLTGAAIFVVLTVCAFLAKDRDPSVVFAYLIFFIPLAPVSNIFPINDSFMLEHWLYVPSIGFFLVAGKAFCLMYDNKYLKYAAVAIFSALIIFYAGLTVKQNTYWKNPIVFYERILKYVQDSPRIYNNLGIAYNAAGDKEKALELYKKAIELNPKFAEAYYNIGNRLNLDGKKEEAVEYYKKTIEANPQYVKAYNNMGVALAETGKSDEAIKAFQTAIRLHPSSSDGYNNLGNMYCAMKRYDEAIEIYNKAASLNASDPVIFYNIGFSYDSSGMGEEAVKFYNRALQLYPAFAAAHGRLAGLHYRAGRYDKAARHCDAALRLGFKVDKKLIEDLRRARR